MSQWMVIDTRRMTEAMQKFVDGYIHFLPHRSMSRHWVETGCWCDPVAYWSDDFETVVVRHKRKTKPKAELVDG